MPQPDAPGSATRYLQRSALDLELVASTTHKPSLRGLLCYHCQQAAEKALKGALVALGEKPPHTHLLGQLIDKLEGHVTIPAHLRDTEKLTAYYTEPRYGDEPDEPDPITADDLAEALQLATDTHTWSSKLVAARASGTQ